MAKEVKLKVMEALQEEAYKGIVRIDSETMKEIGVRPGDIIEIEGGRKTVGIVDRAYPTDVGESIIRMDGILRRNAKTGISEVVTVSKVDVKEAKSITIAPNQKGVMIQAHPDLFKRGLLGRAVLKGDIVMLGGAKRRRKTMSESPFFDDIFSVLEENFMGSFGFGSLKFIVAEANPKQAVIITESTVIKVSPKAIDVIEERIPEVAYEDLGGLDDEIKKIREMVELPLRHPEIFERLGVEPPKGVLLHGPPGSGKTLLAKAVANETESNFILVNGPEVMNKFVGEAEKRIRDIFEEAEKSAPSIIFIDEIDAIAPKREESYSEVERRVVAQLLCLDPTTKIYLPGKTVQIKELYDEVEGEIFTDEFGVEYKLPKDEVKIQAIDKDGKLTKAKLISLTKTNIPEAYSVKLANGSEIKTSKITKFLTLDNEGLRWINANEVKEGQYLLVPKKLKFDEKIQKIDLFNLSKKDKWVAKLPKNGLLNKIFDRNYAFLNEIDDLIKNKKIKIRTSKKRGDLRDKLMNLILDGKEHAKEELQKTLSISRKGLNNAVKIIDNELIALTDNHSKIKLNIIINKDLAKEVEEVAFKEDSKLYPIKDKYFIKTPKVLDENLAKFLGLLISDGHLNDDGVNVSGETSAIAKSNIEKILSVKKRFGIEKSLDRLDIDSKALAQFFNDYFKIPTGKKSYTVRIPKDIFISPVSVRSAFIAGLFEGDGGAIGKILISSCSRNLIEDTIKLLLSIDILASYKRYNIHNAIVYGGYSSIYNFYEKIFPYLELKRKKANVVSLINKLKKISTIKYPIKEKLHGLRESYNIRLDDNMYRYLSPNLNYYVNSNVLGYMVQKLGNIENEFVSEIIRLHNSDLVPCRVESVKEILNQGPMYDLTTTSSNFLAGDIPVLVHNTAMDGLKSRGKVVVIGATNRVNAIDPALRRPGRFDREINIGVPDQKGREAILNIHTRNMPLARDVKLKELAKITYGFVGADLSALTKEAAMNVVRKLLPTLKLKENTAVPINVLEKLMITDEDFKYSLKVVRPSALREVLIEKPSVTWQDVGGMDDVKQELKEAVEWPLKHPRAFERLGVRAPKGILLYGPPGTGKTLLAKAIANESDANFILVKGPELISKWVGESEKGIRKIFEKARQVSPTIIFFDEIDAIAGIRGSDQGTKVTERMVNQLLTEIDGLEDLHDVIIIGATNRPDMVDPGLLRPGRFDRIIMTPVPNKGARDMIFSIHTKNMPLAKDVLITKLVNETENYSGADIENICREAAMLSLRENINAKEIKMNHFEEALKKVRPSLDVEDVRRYKEIEEVYLKDARAGRIKETASYLG